MKKHINGGNRMANSVGTETHRTNKIEWTIRLGRKHTERIKSNGQFGWGGNTQNE